MLPCRSASAAEVAALVHKALGGETSVRLALLFGSQAYGQARSSSDVDLAVHLDTPQDLENAGAFLFRQLQAIHHRLELALGTEVDLVLLNTASPGIAAEALRGKPVIVRDERLYLELLCEKTREAEELREWTFDLVRWRRRLRKEAAEDGPSKA